MSEINKILEKFDDKELQFELTNFKKNIETFFKYRPVFVSVASDNVPIIHSIKSRIKDRKHLMDKIQRKISEGRVVSVDNFLQEITDLIGVRVLHLYLGQFETIHETIMKQESDGIWYFPEAPKAYTWDPDSENYFQSLGIKTELKDSLYTSVHYLVKPNNRPDSVCCEIQVRTLFEEIWGEIDHSMNYPQPTKNLACKEQLKVLARLVSTGTKLSDSIFKVHLDSKNQG